MLGEAVTWVAVPARRAPSKTVLSSRIVRVSGFTQHTCFLRRKAASLAAIGGKPMSSSVATEVRTRRSTAAKVAPISGSSASTANARRGLIEMSSALAPMR